MGRGGEQDGSNESLKSGPDTLAVILPHFIDSSFCAWFILLIIFLAAVPKCSLSSFWVPFD
jgi:hypothetical protein